jgi:hypothetical protein
MHGPNAGPSAGVDRCGSAVKLTRTVQPLQERALKKSFPSRGPTQPYGNSTLVAAKKSAPLPGSRGSQPQQTSEQETEALGFLYRGSRYATLRYLTGSSFITPVDQV